MTRHGRVRGYLDGDIKVFKGVRYGADTTTRRFQPPVPPRAWRGIVDATAYGHASPQKSDEPDQDEDCLFLNIWTPALADGGLDTLEVDDESGRRLRLRRWHRLRVWRRAPWNPAA